MSEPTCASLFVVAPGPPVPCGYDAVLRPDGGFWCDGCWAAILVNAMPEDQLPTDAEIARMINP